MTDVTANRADHSRTQAKSLISAADRLVIGLIFLVGAVYQLINPLVADVSWLIDVNEKMLGGARLYVDVIETNPPMAVFLYTPAVLLQSLTGVPAGILQVFVTLGVVALSLALAGRIMRMSGRSADVPRYLIMAAFVLVVTPLYAFSEREHIAIALVLPVLAVIAARASDHQISLGIRVTAGLAAGIAVCIKPHFAAGLLLPSLYLAIRFRSVRVLFSLENGLAAGVILMHLGIVLVVFPVYVTDIVPMLIETYRAMRLSPQVLLTGPDFLITVGIGIATVMLIRREAMKPHLLVPLLAATGFLIAFLEQGKGWIYQLYPALALVLILFLTQALPGISRTMAGPNRFAARSIFAVMLCVACLIGLMRVVSVLKGRNLAAIDIVERIRPIVDHPRVLALSSDLSIGHPLTRMVGGSWVGTFGQQILTQSAVALSNVPGTSPERLAQLAGWIARDRDYLAHDLKAGHPDLVLVERDNYPWDDLMASGSEAAMLLTAYQRIDTINAIDILVPRDRVATALASGALGR